MTSSVSSTRRTASSAPWKSTPAAEPLPSTARRLGLISDTHGLLRESARQALRGCELILHAGDIGDAAVLAALSELAPVIAVRGNNDTQHWAATQADCRCLQLGAQRLHLLHDLKTLGFDPQTAGVHIVVTGHTHRPKIEWRQNVLFINPGSAGPRRFSLPISLARLHLDDAVPRAELLTLPV